MAEKNMLFMGVDMGTSGCKAVVFDERFRVVSEAFREYPFAPAGDGSLELDAEAVWLAIEDSIREANGGARDASSGADGVRALSISAIGDVIIPLDGSGKPTRNAIVDFDRRGQKELDGFVSGFGEERFFGLTGMPPLYIGSLAKMLWIRENEPHIFERTRRWATFEDFIAGRLGCEPCVSYSEAARTMCFDIREKKWAAGILAGAQADEKAFARPVASGTALGSLGPAAAGALGFTGKAKIVSGGHDMVCAAIGAGLDEDDPGTAIDIAGTIEGIVATMKDANTSAPMLENRLPCYPGMDNYVTFSVNLSAGGIFRWMRDNIAEGIYSASKRQGRSFASDILSKLDENEPGDLFVIPHFSGSGTPRFDPDALGCLYGLKLDTDKRDIARAIEESLMYELRLHLGCLEKAGIRVEALRACGGGAGSDNKLQMKSNITGLPIIKSPISESSAMGAAACAAMSEGIVGNPAHAYAMIKGEEKVFEPDAAAGERFSGAFERYARLADAVKAYEANNLEIR